MCDQKYSTNEHIYIKELDSERENKFMVQFSSVQLLSHVQLFATPWIAARQASLSITNSRSLLKWLMKGKRREDTLGVWD